MLDPLCFPVVLQVLSVVAQLLLILRQARLDAQPTVMFQGRLIPLKEHHVVVTMNPGYLGRTELPDNLKVRSGASSCRTLCMRGGNFPLLRVSFHFRLCPPHVLN